MLYLQDFFSTLYIYMPFMSVATVDCRALRIEGKPEHSQMRSLKKLPQTRHINSGHQKFTEITCRNVHCDYHYN